MTYDQTFIGFFTGMLRPLSSFRACKLSLAAALFLFSANVSAELIEVAQSPTYLWNGVTVSTTGRIFASFPRMGDAQTISVGEIRPDGSIRPYPGGPWNEYQKDASTQDRFVGVNAVVSDENDQLWVVDAAGGFGSVPLKGAAKLVQIDIATNEVKRVYPFNEKVLPEKGFINDVRIGKNFAYLTDSGLGALLVLNLESGEIRRVLAEDPRLKADPNLVLKVDGKPYLNSENKTPQMHVNPLEISPDGFFLYFQPNGGPRLYRLQTDKLNDINLDEKALAEAVVDQGPTRFNAGMTMTKDGSIYYSDIESAAISRRRPDGTFEIIVRDPVKLIWPDASRLGPDGYLYFPAAQINRLPNNSASGKSELVPPYHLFKVKIPAP